MPTWRCAELMRWYVFSHRKHFVNPQDRALPSSITGAGVGAGVGAGMSVVQAAGVCKTRSAPQGGLQNRQVVQNAIIGKYFSGGGLSIFGTLPGGKLLCFYGRDRSAIFEATRRYTQPYSGVSIPGPSPFRVPDRPGGISEERVLYKVEELPQVGRVLSRSASLTLLDDARRSDLLGANAPQGQNAPSAASLAAGEVVAAVPSAATNACH